MKKKQICPYCDHDESWKSVKVPGETFQFCDVCSEMYSVKAVIQYETGKICEGCFYWEKKCKCKQKQGVDF